MSITIGYADIGITDRVNFLQDHGEGKKVMCVELVANRFLRKVYAGDFYLTIVVQNLISQSIVFLSMSLPYHIF